MIKNIIFEEYGTYDFFISIKFLAWRYFRYNTPLLTICRHLFDTRTPPSYDHDVIYG